MLALVAGTLVFSACNEEIFNNEKSQVAGNMTFTASVGDDEGGETRATIDGRNVVWSAGDEIMVISDGDFKTKNKFTLASGVGTTNASFIGTCTQGSCYYAISPYKSSSYYYNMPSRKNESFELAFDSRVQTIVDGSCDPAVPMIAQTTDVSEEETSVSLNFKNIYSFVKVTTDYKCKYITLTSKNSSDIIAAADASVMLDSVGNPYINNFDRENVSNQIILKGKDDAPLEAGTYYIAVFPGTLANGFDFSITNIYEEKTLTKSTTKSVKLKRGTVLNLGEISNRDVMISMAGTGTVADPYIIHDIDQLEGMRDFVNNSTGGADCYKLADDIDGEGRDFDPIGTLNKPFFGQFDGNGKTIKNLKLGQYYAYVVNFGITSGYDNLVLRWTYISALFGIVRDAVLKNVTIDNMTMYDCERINTTQGTYAKSPFVGVCIGNEDSKTTISGVTVTANQSCGLEETRLKLNYFYIYGGIVAASTGNVSIDNCTNYSGIDGTYSYTCEKDDCNEGFFGGILGFAQGGVGNLEDSGLDFGAMVHIDKCRNFGDFKFTVHPLAHMNIGGILGGAWNYFSDDDVCPEFVNCVNFGTLLTTGDDDGVGGVVSYLHNNSIERVGGIVGHLNTDGFGFASPYVYNCANNGAIDTFKPAAGIIGESEDASSIKLYYCASYGTISKKGYSSLIGNEVDDVDVKYYYDNLEGATAQDCVTAMNKWLEENSSPYCRWRLYPADNTKLDLEF